MVAKEGAGDDRLDRNLGPVPAEDRMKAFVGVQRIVEEMLTSGEEPPVAIADKHYSGKFQVRVLKRCIAVSRSVPQSRAFP